jgi:osmotically-inducible protein OsmY
MKKRTDSELKRNVTDELRWDTHVKETDVGVEVKAGTVTLHGTVDRWTDRLAAQDAVHRVSGVLDVANDIEVKLPTSVERNDTDIAQAVRRALEGGVLVPHEQIRTTVSKGVVTLEGHVPHGNECRDAAMCVRNLAGVRAVQNFIRVDPPARPASVAAVRSAIGDALERHALHAVKHVQIGVVGGEVTLRGEVPSWPERSAIEGAVRGTVGVSKVDNQLRIRSWETPAVPTGMDHPKQHT